MCNLLFVIFLSTWSQSFCRRACIACCRRRTSEFWYFSGCSWSNKLTLGSWRQTCVALSKDRNWVLVNERRSPTIYGLIARSVLCTVKYEFSQIEYGIKWLHKRKARWWWWWWWQLTPCWLRAPRPWTKPRLIDSEPPGWRTGSVWNYKITKNIHDLCTKIFTYDDPFISSEFDLTRVCLYVLITCDVPLLVDKNFISIEIRAINHVLGFLCHTALAWL